MVAGGSGSEVGQTYDGHSNERLSERHEKVMKLRVLPQAYLLCIQFECRLSVSGHATHWCQEHIPGAFQEGETSAARRELNHWEYGVRWVLIRGFRAVLFWH